MGAAVGMALAGLRPVVEMRVVDFALCAIDEIVNQAAKNRFMFGGQGRVPLVARLPIGIWSASAAQHSQSLEAWFAHIPGLVVVTPGDAGGQLRPAHRGARQRRPGRLHGAQGAVGRRGRSRPRRGGRDRPGACRASGRAAHDRHVVARVAAVPRRGRSARPAGRVGRGDRPAHALALGPRRGARLGARAPGACSSCTRRCRSRASAPRVAATVAEALAIPVRRLGAPRIPVGYSRPLEDESRLSAARSSRSGEEPAAMAELRAMTRAADRDRHRLGQRHRRGDGGWSSRARATARSASTSRSRCAASARGAANADTERHHAIQADVTDEARLIEAFDEAQTFLGRLDVLVTSAGVAETTPFMDLDGGDLPRASTTSTWSAPSCASARPRSACSRARASAPSPASPACAAAA